MECNCKDLPVWAQILLKEVSQPDKSADESSSGVQEEAALAA